MNAFIAIFIGGGLGSLLRYSISLGLKKYESGFPFATLTANILSCIVLGAAWIYFSRNTNYPDQTKLLIMTGFCGGFSTFSTFSLETLRTDTKSSVYLSPGICTHLYFVLFTGIILYLQNHAIKLRKLG